MFCFLLHFVQSGLLLRKIQQALCSFLSRFYLCPHSISCLIVLCPLHLRSIRQSLATFRPHFIRAFVSPFCARLLGRFSPERLFVSLKFLPGSFHSFLPTLFVKNTLTILCLALALPLATTSRHIPSCFCC